MFPRASGWYHVRMEKQSAEMPSPWMGMLACAAIATAAFLATASVARAFLP